MTNINNVPASTPSASIKSVISPDNHTDTSWMSHQQYQNDMENARRYSYGWHTPNNNMTPQSTTGMRFNQYPLTSNTEANKDVSQIMCPQYQQIGFCTRSDICPFAHIPITTGPFFNSITPQQSLYQQYNNQPQKQDPYFLSSNTLPLQQQQQPQHHKVNKNQHRRNTNMPEQDRFADAEMDDFVGKLYELCKDQNGCRFLQKKIEDKEEGTKNLEIVFNEIYAHFTELMTGKEI